MILSLLQPRISDSFGLVGSCRVSTINCRTVPLRFREPWHLEPTLKRLLGEYRLHIRAAANIHDSGAIYRMDIGLLVVVAFWFS